MDSFLAKLKQDAKCSLCSNTLYEPKLLKCFHTFCKSCIKSNANLKEQVNVFKCPNCSTETLLQELSDVEDLPSSPVHSRIVQVLEFAESENSCSVSASHSAALHRCLVCNRSLCDECMKYHAIFFAEEHKVISLSELKEEDLMAMLTKENPCRTHINNKVELFCNDCTELVCWTCMKSEHKDHKTMTLHEFKAIRKTSLTKDLEEIVRVGGNETEKKEQEQIATKMKRDGEKATEEVKKKRKKLDKFLFDEEQQLLSKIQRSVTRADVNLALVRHNPAAQEYIKNMIENGTAGDLIDLNKHGDCTEFTYNPFIINTAGIVFDKEFNHQVLNGSLGNIRLTKKSNPVLSEVKYGQFVVQTKAILSIVTKHSSGELNYDDSDIVDVTFTPEDNVKDVRRLDKADGELKVEFTPQSCGHLTAEVKLNGKSVANSPIKETVRPQNLSSYSGYKDLNLALNTGSKDFTGIAVNKANTRIAVADFQSHCIRVFNIKGELLLMYGSQGRGEGQLMNPRGLAFATDVDLVIADCGNNRICIINTTIGSLVKSFGSEGHGKGEFSEPFDVYVNKNSNIIVCDKGNKLIQVFTKDGEYQFELILDFQPYSVVTHNDRFYVSCLQNPMIHVFERKDDTTTVAFTIEGDSNFGFELKKPCGLALDKDDNLLVCDQTGIVYKFSLDGRSVGKGSSYVSRTSIPPRYITAMDNGVYIYTSASQKGCCCIKKS